MVFVFVLCFFERKRTINPLKKATIIGDIAKFDKGVTARITANIAAIKPVMMNNFLLMLFLFFDVFVHLRFHV